MKQSKAIVLFIAILVFSSIAGGQSSGGNYAVTQTVVASGGGQNSASGFYALDGTIGQPLAGNALNGSPFAVTSGFWNFSPLAPTAASVSLSGRILAPNGSGLKNAVVTLSGGLLTQPLVSRSGSFGYFSFEGVAVGQTYILTVHSKRYGFTQQSLVVTLMDEISGIVFQANWEN
jgi:hypothetical protein